MKIFFTLFIIFFSFLAKGDYWTQKSSFGGGVRSAAFSFSIGTKGYIGCGINASLIFKNDFWEYDQSTNMWTQKADFGGIPRYYAGGFSLAGKGYAGLGVDENDNALSDIWEYDPGANTWIQKTNFSGGNRYSAITLSTTDNGFISTGATGSNTGFQGFLNDMWQYDSVTDTWIQKNNLPAIQRASSVGFIVGNKAYIGTGIDTLGLFHLDFWEFNIALNSWTQKADFAGQARVGGCSFSIGNNGYIGTGSTGVGGWFKDLWQFDISLNQWTLKAFLPTAIGREGAVSFSIANKGYLGLGGISPPYYNDFWEYTPDPTGIEESPTSTLQFIISPNPAKEFLVISYSLTGNEKINLIISDLNGKKILQTQLIINNNQSTISLKGFSKGIYFVEMSNGKQKAVKKFLKE